MSKERNGAGKATVARALNALLRRFADSAESEDVKMTVQDFLRVAAALHEERAGEAIEEVRVKWVGRNADKR